MSPVDDRHGASYTPHMALAPPQLPMSDRSERRGRLGRVLGTALLYGALGPPIGTLYVVLSGSRPSSGTFIDTITTAAALSLIAYVLTLVPALLTGIFVGFLLQPRGPVAHVMGAGLIGWLATGGWLIGGYDLIGGLAATTVAAIVEGLAHLYGRVRRLNSA